jgi:hypothetical protein
MEDALFVAGATDITYEAVALGQTRLMCHATDKMSGAGRIDGRDEREDKCISSR